RGIAWQDVGGVGDGDGNADAAAWRGELRYARLADGDAPVGGVFDRIAGIRIAVRLPIRRLQCEPEREQGKHRAVDGTIARCAWEGRPIRGAYGMLTIRGKHPGGDFSTR